MMDNFQGYVEFWVAAAVVYSVYKAVDAIIKDAYETLRAKYIVWLWKRRK